MNSASARLPAKDGVAPVPSVMKIGSWRIRSKGYDSLSMKGPDIGATGMHRAYFEGTVDEVLVDKVTYAKITSGISFELPDPEAVIGRWQQTIDLVREAPAVPAETVASGSAARR